MDIMTHPRTTRVLGEEQGYLPLPIIDMLTDTGVPCITSVWLPNAEELAALNAGACVAVTLLGGSQPPIIVGATMLPVLGKPS